MDSRIKVAAELLLYSGKSVLLAGAPGTGKTKLGFELAREFTGIDPLSIVGRGDLASRDLLYSYEPHATGFRLVLGELSLSILASWIRLLKGLSPRWLLLDELNRMNAEIVLGSLFTALDIAHRDRIAVVPSWLVKHVLGDNELLAEVARAADVDKDVAKKLLREVIEVSSQQGLSGLPLPYSWRAIATINLLDRSHLFGLGFALLRRFPIVLFPELGGDFQPRIEPQAVEDKHEMYKNNKIYKRIYNLFDGADSVCVKALKELRSTSKLAYYDAPLHMVDVKDWPAREIFDKYRHSFYVVILIITKMLELGVELGIALIADICRLFSVAMLRGGVDDSLLADLAVSSLLLPQLGSIAPRIKSEILFGGSRARAERVKELLELIEELLGAESMSAMYAEALKLEIPL